MPRVEWRCSRVLASRIPHNCSTERVATEAWVIEWISWRKNDGLTPLGILDVKIASRSHDPLLARQNAKQIRHIHPLVIQKVWIHLLNHAWTRFKRRLHRDISPVSWLAMEGPSGQLVVQDNEVWGTYGGTDVSNDRYYFSFHYSNPIRTRSQYLSLLRRPICFD